MMNILYILLVVIEIPLVSLFLKFFWPDRCKQSFITKVFCSLVFVLCGVVAIKITGNNTLFADYMLIGLILGMVGDLLLHALTDKMWILALGVVAFLAGHIYYIMALQRAIYTTYPGSKGIEWYEILGVLVILAIVMVYVIRKDLLKKKGAMTVGLLAYGVVLAIMLCKSLRYAIGEIVYGTNDHMFMVSLTIGVGAILFFISDATLGIILTDDKPTKRGMRIFNIATYYTAQILLASSIFFVFSRELY